MQTSGKAGEKLFWYGFVFVKFTVIMPMTFEGGLKYEEGDARNLKELMLNKPVMDNIYEYTSDSLKVFFFHCHDFAWYTSIIIFNFQIVILKLTCLWPVEST